jgi:hypothetical protein
LATTKQLIDDVHSINLALLSLERADVCTPNPGTEIAVGEASKERRYQDLVAFCARRGKHDILRVSALETKLTFVGALVHAQGADAVAHAATFVGSQEVPRWNDYAVTRGKPIGEPRLRLDDVVRFERLEPALGEMFGRQLLVGPTRAIAINRHDRVEPAAPAACALLDRAEQL